MPIIRGIRVLIVDDHPVVRCGLLAAIRRQPDIMVVGEVADLGQALALCRTHPPDVILLDLKLPDMEPDQAVTQIRSVSPLGRILLLGTDEAGEDLYRALEAGASGCVLRTAELDEVVNAIRTIHAARPWLSSEVAEQWSAYRSGVRLSDDELVCLRLLADGSNCRSISSVLGWDEGMVRERIRGIQTKLGAQNETHMLVIALQRGIVSVE